MYLLDFFKFINGKCKIIKFMCWNFYTENKKKEFSTSHVLLENGDYIPTVNPGTFEQYISIVFQCLVLKETKATA